MDTNGRLPTLESTENLAVMCNFAQGFAASAHIGQLYNDEAYIQHSLRVAQPFAGTLRYIPAILHDTVEDSGGRITIADIRRYFGVWTAGVVDSLSRREGERYILDYIERLALNPDAVAIKISDLAENMAHCLLAPEKYATKLKRYQMAAAKLEERFSPSK